MMQVAFRGDSHLSSFYERTILNSPYRPPALHHPLDSHGQPLDGPPRPGRRPARFIAPVPSSRKKASAGQGALELEAYEDYALINEIRGHLESWRALRNPADWNVSAATQRLLEHWRHHEFNGPRPFFCQIEAAETIIRLTEVAPRRAAAKSLPERLARANEEANPAVFRIATKMAMRTAQPQALHWLRMAASAGTVDGRILICCII